MALKLRLKRVKGNKLESQRTGKRINREKEERYPVRISLQLPEFFQGQNSVISIKHRILGGITDIVGHIDGAQVPKPVLLERLYQRIYTGSSHLPNIDVGRNAVQRHWLFGKKTVQNKRNKGKKEIKKYLGLG